MASTRSIAPRNRSVRPSESGTSMGPKRCSVASVFRPCSARYSSSASSHASSVSWILRCSRTHSNWRPDKPRSATRAHSSSRDGVQPIAVGERAALLDEPIEHCVYQRAAVHRPQLDDVLGLLGRVDVQQVVHEVGVRARDPCFEAGGREHHPGRGRRPPREFVAQVREIAVEAREFATPARGDELASTHVARCVQGCAREHRPQVVLVRGRGEVDARDTVEERRDRCAPGRARFRERAPDSACTVSSRNRDGTCSVLRRRSPRGKQAPDRRRSQRVPRAARGGPLPSGRRATPARRASAARSLSLNSGSSPGAAGNTPSANPHTNTRSRSAPSAKPTGPTSTPSPSRPIRSRAAPSSNSSVRRNTGIDGAASTASKPDRRSSAPSTRRAASCSNPGHDSRRRSSPIHRRISWCAHRAFCDHDAGTRAGSRSSASASTNARS